ncbi:MAG: ATP-dependent DNA helicase RecG [Bdellovibrio sp.]
MRDQGDLKKPKLKLETDVKYLKGVGPKLGALLAKRGIRTVLDLLTYYPRAYEDRRAARNIGTLKENDLVSLKAQVIKVSSVMMGRSKRKMYDVLIRDSSGQIHCKYFRVPYKGYFERFQPFQDVRIVGKVTNYRGKLEFHHPDLRDIEPDEELQDILAPIYVEIENLSSMKIARMIRSVFEHLPAEAVPVEKFSPALREKYNLLTRWEALWQLHNPQVDQAALLMEQRSDAHRRIIFEEFFWMELYLAARKTGLQKEPGIAIPAGRALSAKLIQSLPFELTKAQKRVIREVSQDLGQRHPMSRLVQGDVGSGKTMVAMLAALQAIEAGHQACLMAPTEILAEQHFRNAKKLFEPLGLKVGLLTGKSKTKERSELHAALESGDIHFLIGTHALIEDVVQFKSLAVVVIDEQHRFGVEQRAKLKRKGLSPHFLVMTATPIPRTLAMTVYGDLDVSVLDELPPGRIPIQTRVIFESKRPEAIAFMAAQIERGRQAYVVYPLVEESEKIDLKNAFDEFEKLRSQFPQIQFGLLHGRMKSDEKDQIMNEFREGRIQVLVSTTVIEVGVDVPNANLMIIEHSERFGLSQLHQLRGRVGRGAHKSFCVMIMGYAVSTEARERTAFMEQTSDGFKIAEFDLELRGPGEFLGTRQSGLPGFQMANLVRDVALLTEAREAAFDLLNADTKLAKPENEHLRNELLDKHGPTALAGIA